MRTRSKTSSLISSIPKRSSDLSLGKNEKTAPQKRCRFCLDFVFLFFSFREKKRSKRKAETRKPKRGAFGTNGTQSAGAVCEKLFSLLFFSRKEKKQKKSRDEKAKKGRLWHKRHLIRGCRLQVAGHEVVHYIKRWNKAGYKTLVRITETSLKSQGVDVEARIKEIQKLHSEKLGETLSRENAMEELVAESFSTVFLQEKAIQTLYETDEGTFRKVIEALNLSDLKAASLSTICRK